MTGDALLSGMAIDLESGRIPLAIYGDPTIYALELERIFRRCWLFLAHESEIPERGNFVKRSLVGTSWIVVRDDAGTIQVLFDSCRHRGSELCPGDKGTATHFRCPFHGWTYKNDGTLIGVPNRQQGYKALDEAEWGLLKAPRVGIYQGLIFCSLDPDAMPLAEYLGDLRWYLAIHFGLCVNGLEVIGEPHRWVVPANWKSAAENFSGDSYHTQTLHRSIVEIGLRGTFAATGMDVHVVECSGHAISIRRAAPGATAFWGDPPEVMQCYDEGLLSAPQLELARGSITHTSTIFPNLSLIHAPGNNDPNRPPTGYLSLALWQPISERETEVWRWMFVPKDAPASYKQRSYEVAVGSFSSSGNLEQDDAVVWRGIARAGRSPFARTAHAQLNYQMGLPGMTDMEVLKDWPGPGLAYNSNLEDGGQRTFFRHWLQLMTDGAA